MNSDAVKINEKRFFNYVNKRDTKAMEKWIDKNGDIFSLIPPRAGAMAFIRYNLPVNSTELAVKLKDEKSVLVVPGDLFGMDSYIRIGYGAKKNCLLEGLDFLEEIVRSL